MARGVRAAADSPRGFFILAAFGWSGTTGADQTDPLAPFCEHNDEEALALGSREEGEARLVAGMLRIVDDPSKRICEDAYGPLKRHPMRDLIELSLDPSHSKIAIRDC